MAMVWDLRAKRIPNGLTLFGVAAGLALRASAGGGMIVSGLEGLGLALLVALPLFALGALGGGDAKLLGVAGAFLGPADLIWAMLAAALLGGALGILVAVKRGVLLPILLNAKGMIVYLLSLGRVGERRSLESPGAVSVPYGVAIALGALFVWFSPELTELI